MRTNMMAIRTIQTLGMVSAIVNPQEKDEERKRARG
jgi:hypothetical protein